MSKEVRVLIADDHPIFRRGLRNVIESDPKLRVVGEAEDGEMALALAENLRPDVAVLDVAMPQKDGFEVMRAVEAQRLPVAVVFLTMHKDERFFNAALNRGARGYVLKDSAVNDIVAAVRAVAAGQTFISPGLSDFLVNRNARAAALLDRKPGLRSLTPTERLVLQKVAARKTSREIAGELSVSVRTVENHRANICEKLGLRGAHALLDFALEHKSEL